MLVTTEQRGQGPSQVGTTDQGYTVESRLEAWGTDGEQAKVRVSLRTRQGAGDRCQESHTEARLDFRSHTILARV